MTGTQPLQLAGVGYTERRQGRFWRVKAQAMQHATGLQDCEAGQLIIIKIMIIL